MAMYAQLAYKAAGYVFRASCSTSGGVPTICNTLGRLPNLPVDCALV